MLDMKETLLTEEGYQKLEAELEYLKVTKRKDAIYSIRK